MNKKLQSYDKARESGAIEARIRPLVDALNKDNVCKTIASCHGHFKPKLLFKGKTLERSPYVLFRANIELARNIAKYLDYGHGLNNEMYYCWKIESYFYPGDWELVWKLTLADIRVICGTDRYLIDKDIKMLSLIIIKITDGRDFIKWK